VKRTPRFYNGKETTTHHLGQILPEVLRAVGVKFSDRPDLILAAWPEIIGAPLAKMAEAVAFDEGVLHVKVKNSSLYSLLNQQDRPRLLQALRQKFPNVNIKTILFRIG
jgi:hypothetical protein